MTIECSHVTETPLNSEAPQSVPEARSGNESIDNVIVSEQEANSNQPEHDVEKVAEHSKSSNTKPENVLTKTFSSEAKSPNRDETIDKTRPTNPMIEGEVDDTEMAESTDPVMLENRDEISLLMRDAGFRSSVPSSIMRNMDFDISTSAADSVVSAGDPAVFNKLLHEKVGLSSPGAYSPKFHGLGSSSPERQVRAVTIEDQQSEDSVKVPDPIEWPLPSARPPQSSWATINSDHEGSSSPHITQKKSINSITEPDNGSSWITDDEDDVPSSPPVGDREVTPRQEPARNAAPSPHQSTPKDESPPVKKASRRTSKINVPVRKVPEGKAMALWEKLGPKTKRASTSSVSSIETSPLPDISKDAAEKDPAPIVTYPKLSLGSSFTSDHGRQPDFNFNDNAVLIAQESDVDMNPSTEMASEPDIEVTTVSRKSSNFGLDGNYSLDEEPELPTPRKSNLRHNIHSESESEEEEDNGDDDDADVPPSEDSFPPLASLSQPNTIKREPSSQSIIKNPPSVSPKKSQIVLEDSEDSEDSDVQNPTASQSHRSAPQSQPMKSRAAVLQPSVPAASQIKPSQSQMIDLTMSSDVEPDDSDNAKPRPGFKTYNLVESDDDDYLGWMPKTKNDLKGLGSRRSTGSGLKDSSAAQNRRKTSSR